MRHYNMPLEQLCAQLLLAAKGLASAIETGPPLQKPADLSALRKAGAALTEESPLSETYAQHLDTARRILESAVDAETTGYSRYFDGIDDLETGQVGTIVEERILTPRGRDLDVLLQRLGHIRYLRDILWSRVTAERHLAQAFGA